MRKTTTLIALFLLLPTLFFAQKALIDSLEMLLRKENDPVRRIDLLCGLGRLNTFAMQMKQSDHYLTEAVQLAQKNGDKKGEIVASLLKLNNRTYKGTFNEVLENRQKAYAEARTLGMADIEVFAGYLLAEDYFYDRGNFTAAQQILEEILSRSDAGVTKKNLGNLFKVLGLVYEAQGKNQQALEAYQKALDLFAAQKTNPDIDPKTGRPSALAADNCLINVSQTHTFLSLFYKKQGKGEQAYFHAGKALQIAQELEAFSLLPNAYFNLGNCELNQNQPSLAVAHFIQGLEIAQKQDDPRSEITLLNQLAYTHQSIGELQTAKDYSLRALKKAESLPDSITMMYSLDQLAWASTQMGQAAEAKLFVDRGMRICMALKDSVELPRLLKLKSEILYKTGNHSEALPYAFQAINLFRRYKNDGMILAMTTLLSRIYLQGGALDSAKIYAEHALQMAESQKKRQDIRYCHRLLSEVWEKRGDFSKALMYQKIYAAWGDSLRNDEATALLKTQQVKQKIQDYKAETDKALQIAALLRTQNQLYLGISVALLAIILGFIYFYWNLRRAKIKIQTQHRQLNDLNQTKDKFFGIIAHDLRNPLTAFQGVGEQLDYYLKKGDTAKLEKISSLIAKSAANLNGLLDNLLSWALLNRGMIPYSPEPLDLERESAENFEIHENAATAKGILLENNILQDLKVQADRNALQAILRNLLGNAVKFTPTGGRVSLGCVEKDGQVFITVNDTGTGIAAEKMEQLFTLGKRSEHGTAGEKGAGLGLLLCKELVEMNQGTLRVFSTQGEGSTFEFCLPSA